MRCPFCGSNLEKNAKYCNDCGTAVDSECSGKNINYRSYTDTRPNSSSIPKTPAYRVRESNSAQKDVQTARPAQTEIPKPFQRNIPNAPTPNVTPGQFGQFKGNTANTKKKSGCGIFIIIIVIAVSFWGIIGSFIDNFDFDSVFSTEPNSQYEYDYDYDSDDYVTEEMNGRIDGKYYLNDYVNFGFTIPEGFEDASVFTFEYDTQAIPDYCFENEDGEFILVGYCKSDDEIDFLDKYTDEIFKNLSDDGLTAEKSDFGEKQVYNNSFIKQSVLRSDGRTVDVYTCPVSDWVFFVEVNTNSADLNNRIADTFINSYTN